jgi:hypothetical protein
MRRGRGAFGLLLAATVFLAAAGPAAEQRAGIDAAVDARLKDLWTTYLDEAARDAGLPVADRRLV